MTKKQLLDLIAEYPDDAEVVIEVHDTSLHEDLYDFYVDGMHMSGFATQKPQYELRLTAINHHENVTQ